MDGMKLLAALGIVVTPVGGLSAELPDDAVVNLIVSEFKQLRGQVEMLSAYQRSRQSLVMSAGQTFSRADAVTSRIDPDIGKRAARLHGR